jgi:putative DNA primase/helicase
MSNHIADFHQAMTAAGIEAPGVIHDDGLLHRFSPSGRGTEKPGWYVLHADEVPAGSFGDWRTGLQSTWCAKSSDAMTAQELAAHRQRIQAMKAQRDAELLATQQKASVAALKRLNSAAPCTQHAYATTKGVQCYGVRIDSEGSMLVPMVDTAGKLQSLQAITPEGTKRFHTGGRVSGCYHAIGKAAGRLIVCEGYATGASIHEATGEAVAVAFNAGNLEAVAVALHAKYPELQLIVAADDDYQTEGNIGMTKAKQAAQAVGGTVAVPEFGPDRPDGATDFNDLHQVAGLDTVRRCIEAAPATGNGWPAPTPLPEALPPVQPFAADLLPVALRGWVMDIAHRMQCPPDFPAVAALVALSSLIGARAVVQPKVRDDWQVVPNLWGMTIGRPGVKKSPALSESLKPLHRLQADEFELHEAAHAAWALDCKVSAMQDDANEKKAKGLASKDPVAARALLEPVETPAEPLARRFIVNDATVEKLGELMTQNPWGTLSYRDELYGLLTGLDKQGQEGARAFYLQSYDGNQGYTFDRIGRGTVHIPRVCLSMIGGIQPGRVQEYVRGAVAGGSADDGLLQRFGLAVWPDTGGEFVHVDQWPDTPAKQAAWSVFERLATLQPANEAEAAVWRFDGAAQALFVEWLVPFENEIRGDDLHPAMISHLSKYRKLIPALALVFAMIDTPDSGGLIGEPELLRALAWSEYLRTHANRLYAAAVTPETTGAAALLAKIKAGKLADGFKTKDVKQKGWSGLSTTEDVRKAAAMLEDYDWLRCDVVPPGAAGGRPSETFRINPCLTGGAA